MDDSGKIVNLRQARKARKRSQGEAAAAQNRVSFGRTKAEKQRDEAEAARLRATLDGARREEEAE